jgi:hypothetical protein
LFEFHELVIAVINESLMRLQLRAVSAGQELRHLSRTACLHQKHLDGGSAEQSYWHHGYYTALLDALRLLGHEPVASSNATAARPPRSASAGRSRLQRNLRRRIRPSSLD